MVVVGVVVPRRRPATICRTRSTLAALMSSWRAQFIEGVMFSISLMPGSFAGSWASSKPLVHGRRDRLPLLGVLVALVDRTVVQCSCGGRRQTPSSMVGGEGFPVLPSAGPALGRGGGKGGTR